MERIWNTSPTLHTKQTAGVDSTGSCAPASVALQDPELQQIRLRYRLATPTFATLCTISKAPDRGQVLQKACLATELRSFPLRRGEKGLFREVNDHLPIPYPIKENLSEPWHKAFLLVQLRLQCIPWPNKLAVEARHQLYGERKRMDSIIETALRCIVDILGSRRDGRGVGVALDVLRSVMAGVWEGSDNELLQIEGIGPQRKERLIEANVKTVKELTRLDFWHIERLLSRNPPFGQQMLHKLAGFPLLTLQVELVQNSSRPQVEPVLDHGCGLRPPSRAAWIARMTLNYENKAPPSWGKNTPWTTVMIEGDDGRLMYFWRGSVKRLTGGKELITSLDPKKREELKVTFACEGIVGTIVRMTHQV
ncbi:DNA helicase [Purpureocillium takamizusanense]|uniref:DNA helicase n=1 Tax=Purpureocillium takamizusanense TaxID=2060973 RepID=A0A9Q8QEK0_9HYPO|nr:DNA helicase [Purpureocillium takamizusanense]UNI18190.1 DNA helicase [Purpureocillium takamizusanense]